MAGINQGFPMGALLDQQGNLTIPWSQFFISMWTRSGGGTGNNSASFNYPTTSGNSGQLLTSQGTSLPTIWTTGLTRTSQLINDSGFVGAGALNAFVTQSQASGTAAKFFAGQLSDLLPLPEQATASAGTSTLVSRADHVHPREASPSFAGTVSANQFNVGNATWTSGPGAPSSTQSVGSLYSNTSGATGSRLYVSNGASWNPVPGV